MKHGYDNFTTCCYFFCSNTATLAISTVVGLEESMSTNLADQTTNEENTETTIGSLITSIAINRWDNEPVSFSEENPLVLTFSVLGVRCSNFFFLGGGKTFFGGQDPPKKHGFDHFRG